MAITYTPIATHAVSGSSTTTISFTSIPQTYTDLVLVCNVSASTSYDLRARFNSSATSLYSATYLSAYSTSSITTARATSQTELNLDYYGTPNTVVGDSIQIINIFNYANTTTYKTLLSRANRASGGVDAIVNMWRSTSAITQIDLAYYPGATYTFGAGSMITLYGIKAA